MNSSSDFFPNNNRNKYSSKKKYRPKTHIDEDIKDVYRSNKSFKHRKREIQEEEQDWENWEDDINK